MTMWNSTPTDVNNAMTTETITIKGHNGDSINAYVARPGGSGPFPAVVLVHHLPGWDELYREFARRFADHGYTTICPNLYARTGHGTPDEVAAKVRAEGGVADAQVVGDLDAARAYLEAQSSFNGKVGIIGTCSGGRQAFMTACLTGNFDAAVDCWGGRVVVTPEELTPNTPVAVVDMTSKLNCPVLGLFGNDDQNPSPAHVDRLEEELKKHGKDYDFHRYDGAGHAFIYHDRGAYRQQQAMDAWGHIFEFFAKNLK